MSEMKVVELQAEVASWERKVEELEGQGRRASERVAGLEEQRNQQILAALAEGDSVAKKKLDELTLELERTVRHGADLALACEQAGQRLDGLRHQLAEVERCVQEDELLKLLQERETIGYQMGQLLEERLLPLLRQAAGLSDEMNRRAALLGLDCPIRERVFTNLLGFPLWACQKAFPIKLGAISGVPVESSDFRPSDLQLDPAEALAAHDQDFRRRLLKEIATKRRAPAGSLVAAS